MSSTPTNDIITDYRYGRLDLLNSDERVRLRLNTNEGLGRLLNSNGGLELLNSDEGLRLLLDSNEGLGLLLNSNDFPQEYISQPPGTAPIILHVDCPWTEDLEANFESRFESVRQDIVKALRESLTDRLATVGNCNLSLDDILFHVKGGGGLADAPSRPKICYVWILLDAPVEIGVDEALSTWIIAKLPRWNDGVWTFEMDDDTSHLPQEDVQRLTDLGRTTWFSSNVVETDPGSAIPLMLWSSKTGDLIRFKHISEIVEDLD
ncbi:hypothetical protein BJX99DRAFT_253980 [Aspergillus californicus]